MSVLIFFVVCVQLSQTSLTLAVYRQPSALPSGESWADRTCADTFYPEEIIAWEWCLLHKSRQGCSGRLRRRQEGDVPSAEPFQDIPGLRGCLCTQGTLAFTPWFSGRTADDDKSLFQVKRPNTSFNQPNLGFHLGPVRRKHFLGSASFSQLVLVSAQRQWCSFLLLARDETREEQGRQMKFLWVHFPLPHSLLQACRDFPMRKCISTWSGKGFFLIVWLPS